MSKPAERATSTRDRGAVAFGYFHLKFLDEHAHSAFIRDALLHSDAPIEILGATAWRLDPAYDWTIEDDPHKLCRFYRWRPKDGNP